MRRSNAALPKFTFFDGISVLLYFCHFPLSHILSGKSQKRTPFERHFQFKLNGWQRGRIGEKIDILFYSATGQCRKQFYCWQRAKRYIIAQNSSQGSTLALTVVLGD
jgi:hypothetical protein